MEYYSAIKKKTFESVLMRWMKLEPIIIHSEVSQKEKHQYSIRSDQIRLVAQSCLTLCDPMNHSTPGLPVHHQLLEFTQLLSIESVMPSSHLILCHPLLLLPPIPLSIRVFPIESTLRRRWSKYWSFSFSIIPSQEIPGLISFRMVWLDLLQSRGLSRVFSNTTVQKHQFFSAQPSSQSNSH